jgi:hypothetical protein
LSTKAFKRIFWIVLDGMGYEHARRCVESSGFQSLSRLARDGYLGPSQPSSPGCQTPSALYTLFSGAEPPESGVWGYRMPHPDRIEASLSGFHARPIGGTTLWQKLGERGQRSSVMNVAFRADPVWTGKLPGLDFGYDGYRLWGWPRVHAMERGREWIEHQGLEVELTQTRDGISIRKGQRVRRSLRGGEGTVIELSRSARAYAHLLRRGLLSLSPLSTALVRGDAEVPGARDTFLDVNAFRFSRGSADVMVDSEIEPSRESMRRKTALMIGAIRATRSRLVIGYFPIIDEFNHVYVHQLEAAWPEGRVSELFRACARLVDDCIGQVMAEAAEGDAVVISSDHGSVSYRSMLHLNEVLAGQGLVRRSGAGYDFARSTVWYHPSDCGLVIHAPGADRLAARAALERALDRARAEHGVDLAMLAGEMTSPYLAFVYPRGDANFTGKAPKRGRAVLDRSDQGGHHLSPLTPTPWIQAMLGLWSPGAGARLREGAPRFNRDVSGFLLKLLDGEA